MKKIIITSMIFLIATICTVRIIHVNSKQSFPILLNYKITDEVPLENDFFLNNKEQTDGYSVKVVGTELLSLDEFVEKYKVENENEETFENTDYVFLVAADFTNVSNLQGEDAGININYFMLQSCSYMTYYFREAFSYVNKSDITSFCLKPNTTERIIIPFRIYKGHISLERFYKNQPKLVVSLYPHKKTIELYE